jgi:putative selenium metabolism hydrolase
MESKHALKQIRNYIHENRDQIIRDLQDFVAIESVTYNEGEAVAYLAQKMRDFQFDEVRVDKVGNVLGRIGEGKTVLLYDAHIDTVETGDPADWTYPPLSGHLEDGIIYGRGAVDDKGCLMGITWAGRALKALGLDQDFTLWISGSVSEEDVEGSAVKAMLEESPDIKPDYVLVAESSELRLIRGHKGRALIRISVPGKAAHASAAWRGDNALIKALPIIQAIDDFNDFEDDPFLGKGTIEVTNVECKSPSLNTIPGEAVITCDRRISCGETIDDLLREAHQFAGKIANVKCDIDTEDVITYTGYEITAVDYFPSWVLAEQHELVQAGAAAYQALFEKAPVITKWDFCTNATHLSGRLGIPAIGFGPGEESLCHSNDDQVPVDELIKAVEFYAALPMFVPKKEQTTHAGVTTPRR